jgi:hypothetical protein
MDKADGGWLMQESTPTRWLVSGVPYVCYADALCSAYPNKEIINPSYPACMQMVFLYWGDNYLGETEDVEKKANSWRVNSVGGAGFEDMKAHLVRNLPVLITVCALTPYAHPVGELGDTFNLMSFPRSAPYSSLLGRMAPLEMLTQNEASSFVWGVQEASFLASRLLIGYDDETKEVTMHCPTFGPAWRISYEQFNRMWQIGAASYSVVKPPDFENRLNRNPNATVYPERTPDQHAAQHLIYGIARSAAHSGGGWAWEAIDELRQGANLLAASKGYLHLLQIELALHGLRGDSKEGLRSAREAVRLLRWNWEGWRVLELLHYRNGNKLRGKICELISRFVYTLFEGVDLHALPKDFASRTRGAIFGLSEHSGEE